MKDISYWQKKLKAAEASMIRLAKEADLAVEEAAPWKKPPSPMIQGRSRSTKHKLPLASANRREFKHWTNAHKKWLSAQAKVRGKRQEFQKAEARVAYIRQRLVAQLRTRSQLLHEDPFRRPATKC